MVAFLVFLLALSVSADQLEDCVSKCEVDQRKAVCKNGCEFASALALAPERKADRPTCNESCRSMFSIEELASCLNGCDHFESVSGLPSVFGIMDRIRNIMSKMISSHLKDSISAAGSQPDPEPITVSRIRIFIPIENPDDALAESGKPAEGMHMQHHQMRPPVGHHMLAIHRGPFDPKSLHLNEVPDCWFHRILHAPFLLLFVVTLSTLLVLTFVQLVVCLRRRRRAAHNHHYSPLPTYMEATNVKVPMEDETKQPLMEEYADA